MAGRATGKIAPSKWRNRILGHGMVDPKKLTANPENWRAHPPHQREALAGVLEQIGWLQSVILNKTTGHLVDGHLRVELAIRESEREIPVTFVKLTIDEERLALATLDPLGSLADTDQAKLRALLGQVQSKDLAVRSLLDQLAKQAKGVDDAEAGGKTPDDQVPAIPEPGRAFARTGDIWQLGDHRIAVGSSGDKALLMRLMGNERADLMLTDPPYNVAYTGAAGAIQGDDQDAKQFAAFLLESFNGAAAACRPGTAFYVFHSDTERVAFAQSLEAAGFGIHQALIWAKNSATFTRHDYNWRHEPILYGWREGAAHYFAFDFTETTLIDQADDLSKLSTKQLRELVVQLLRREATTTVVYEDKPTRSVEHPTMKPVALLARLIGNSSRRGELVLDTFGGSGSTLIAAAKLGRRARLVEIDPRFADVTILRWQEWAGQKAVCAVTGESFAERVMQAGKANKRKVRLAVA